MTQQRSTDDIRADVRYLNDHEAQTGRRSSAHVLLTHDVEPLLARVAELEQENARLRGQQRDDLDDYAVDELPKALRQLSAAEQRAERAEALAVEKCQRVAAAVRAARAAGPAGLSPQEGRDDG